MTTTQASEKWGIPSKRISRLCATGIIPGVEKTNKWNIPDEAIKPPLTRNKACHIMMDMLTTIEGAKPNKLYTMEDCEYLANCGFITDITGCETVEEIITLAKPTTTGKDLLKAESQAIHKNLTFESQLELNLGVAKAGLTLTNA